VSDLPSERPQSPKTLKDFARSVGTYLPRQLGELRRLGKQTRALSGRRPKR
jgi:hypothetical protein